MGEVVALYDPQDRSRAVKKIRRLWNEGSVEILQHAKERMAERDLDIHDVQNILQYGQITEISHPHAHWRYTITGRSIENNRAKCIVEINGRLIIVTVVDLTRARKKKGDENNDL
jgi:hypothetical protein